ncbi:MAG: hypothetical protein ABFS42_15075 [Candidatus Krumholzibacteriota bacterium]
MKSLAACILALIIAGPSSGEDFLPLETGYFWTYVADDGVQEMRLVGEQVPVFTGSPYEIEYPISANNQGLVNYWTSEADGDVLLWGFFRNGWGYLYQPPIRMLDAPLSVGKTWTTTVDLYSLPDTVFVETAEITLMVHESLDLTVPAGVFPAFGIGSPDPGTKTLIKGGFTLWGESMTDKVLTTDAWYSEGVGEVQYNTERLYRLETYTDHPVAVQVSSWGAVKALYHGKR